MWWVDLATGFEIVCRSAKHCGFYRSDLLIRGSLPIDLRLLGQNFAHNNAMRLGLILRQRTD